METETQKTKQHMRVWNVIQRKSMIVQNTRKPPTNSPAFACNRLCVHSTVRACVVITYQMPTPEFTELLIVANSTVFSEPVRTDDDKRLRRRVRSRGNCYSAIAKNQKSNLSFCNILLLFFT